MGIPTADLVIEFGFENATELHNLLSQANQSTPEFDQWRLRDSTKAGLIKLIKCLKCGQYDQGHTGEYPCDVCGLPLVWDE